MAIKLLSEKVSYSSDNGRLQILILGKIDKWKESILLGWLLAWVFCGGVVISEYVKTTDRDLKMIFVIFLIFWAYYLWRVAVIFVYRRGGNELVRVQDGVLTLKRSFFTYGKSKTYNLNQITDFQKIELSKKSIAYTYENGWWVLGGEKLSFKYHGKYVKFAMQVKEPVRDKLYTLINQQISKALKSGI